MSTEVGMVLPQPDVDYPVVLGKTFLQQSNAKHINLRYDFKPASVSRTQPGVLQHDNAKGAVSVWLPNNHNNELDVHFNGPFEPSQINDCVIVFDGTTFRFEVLNGQFKTKHFRDQPYRPDAHDVSNGDYEEPIPIPVSVQRPASQQALAAKPTPPKTTPKSKTASPKRAAAVEKRIEGAKRQKQAPVKEQPPKLSTPSSAQQPQSATKPPPPVDPIDDNADLANELDNIDMFDADDLVPSPAVGAAQPEESPKPASQQPSSPSSSSTSSSSSDSSSSSSSDSSSSSSSDEEGEEGEVKVQPEAPTPVEPLKIQASVPEAKRPREVLKPESAPAPAVVEPPRPTTTSKAPPVSSMTEAERAWHGVESDKESEKESDTDSDSSSSSSSSDSSSSESSVDEEVNKCSDDDSDGRGIELF